jgi:hypothetical protein
LDRDGNTFFHVVDYLRENGKSLPKLSEQKLTEAFDREIQYWEIESSYFVEQRIPFKIRSMFKNQPKVELVNGTLAPTVQTWIKLESIDLMDFYLKLGKQQFFNSIKKCMVNDEFGVPEEHALDFGEYYYPHNLHHYVG